MKIIYHPDFKKDLEKLFSQRLYHRIKRGFDFLIGTPREIKYGFQRMFRGYDDRCYWEVGDYLGRMIVRHLKNFKESERVGFHVVDENDYYEDKEGSFNTKDGAEEKWEKVIDDMIEGWEYLILDPIEREPWKLYQEKKISNKEWQKREKEDYEVAEKKAMLFVKYFNALWD